MDKPAYHYHILFAGKVKPELKPAAVKQTIATALRLSAEKAEALFDGKKRIIKRSETLEQAEAFVRLFDNAGAIAFIETADGKPVATPPEKQASATPASTEKKAAQKKTPEPLPLFRPFPSNWLFKPTLFIATAIETLLTLFYVVSLTGAVLLLVYFTLLADWLHEAIPYAFLASLVSLLLLIAGTLTLALLAKPLLGLIRRKEPYFKLNHELEPEFFRYADEIAALVGANPPTVIRVNHTAYVTVRPLLTWEGILKRYTVLTVGLPLLTALDSRQLAALLAQALYPWRPGFMPRLGQILDSNIRWLHRAGFDRDILDRKLNEWQHQFPRFAKPLAYIERFTSWAARPAQQRLRFSRFLSRRIIHRLIADADAAARQVAGNDSLRVAMERSRLLAFASQNTLPALEKMWQEKGRLPDNLAQAVVARSSSYPPQIQTQLNQLEERRSSETGGFKPTTSQRLKLITIASEKGSYELAAPCAAFFRRLEKLQNIMTVRYYHGHLHIPVTTNKLTRTPLRGSQEFEADSRIARFFGPVYADFVPLRLRAQLNALHPNAADLALQWQQGVAQLLAEQQKTKLAATTFASKDEALIEVTNKELLQRAGVGLSLSGLVRLKGGEAAETLQQECRDAEGEYDTAISQLERQLKPYTQRLTTALAMLKCMTTEEKIPKAPHQYMEVEQLLDVYERIEANYPKLRELRQSVIQLESLLSYQAIKSTPKLQDRINELSDDIRRILTAFGVTYKQTPYPFTTEEHYRNLFDWVLGQAIEGEGPLGDFDRGSDTFRRIALMQRLIIGRLTTLALGVEASLGLKPGNGVKKA